MSTANHEPRKPTFERVLEAIAVASGSASGIGALLEFVGFRVSLPLLLVGVVIAISSSATLATYRRRRDDELPMPRWFWKLLLGVTGWPIGTRVSPLKIAMVSRPRSIEDPNTVGLTKLEGWEVVRLSTLDSEVEVQGDPSAALVTLVVDSAGVSARQGFERFLDNRHALVLLWSTDWSDDDATWALRAMSRWGRNHPDRPCIAVKLQPGIIQPPLRWINFVAPYGTTSAQCDPLASPIASLLSQSISRNTVLRRLTSHTRWIAGICVLCLILGSLTAYQTSRQLERGAGISAQALQNFADASAHIEDILATDVNATASRQNEQRLGSFQKLVASVESGVSKQLGSAFRSQVETTLFVRVPSSDSSCFCEATNSANRPDCFPESKSIISCAMQSNRVVHWQRGALSAAPERIQAWLLNGQADISDIASDCHYAPPRVYGPTGLPTGIDGYDERREILCLPLGTDMQAVDSAKIGLCVALEKPTGRLLDRVLRTQIVLMTNFLRGLPWDWYASHAPHLACTDLVEHERR